ncbi:MAG: hypothetical protein IPP77_14965 [Bacteroidetes bacterium]|nr:hypothetical protein [Bacteroidota bacterium]
MIGSTPNVKVGDILVSGEGDGYIRRVTAISVNGSVYTITTTQATLEDVFIQGHLVFDFDLNFLKTGKNLGLIDSVLARTLYKDASLSVVLSAQLQYAPTFHYDFWFDTAGIASCDITATNASYSSSASVKVTATQAASLLNRTDTLRKYNKIYRSWNLVNGYPPRWW